MYVQKAQYIVVVDNLIVFYNCKCKVICNVKGNVKLLCKVGCKALDKVVCKVYNKW